MKLEQMIPAERDVPRLAARKAHLVREVESWSSNNRRRRQRRVLIFVPAVLVLLAATGFTTYALVREPIYESVACFERAAMNANVSVVSADGRDPVEICKEVFRISGPMELAISGDLEACVLDTGAIGVFPRSGGSVCRELELAALPATYPDQAEKFGLLRKAIVARIGEPASGSSRGGPQCVGEEEAVLIVRRELLVNGYEDWDVKVAGGEFSPRQPCADVSFSSADKLVLLTPAGPRG
jgi:hypothetical protein